MRRLGRVLLGVVLGALSTEASILLFGVHPLRGLVWLLATWFWVWALWDRDVKHQQPRYVRND